jgi:PAS domain S-box-containing protein
MPILSHGRQVIGSFALYYREKRGPTSKDWRLISTAAHLAGIAIEAQRSEEALRRSEERNRATLRAIPDLIFLLSAEGDYLDCHARRPEQLLLPPSQLIGKNIRDVLPRDLAERFAEICWKVAKIDEPQVMEYELTVGGGRRDSEARVVRAGDNTVLVLVRDITERKRAEKELRRNSEQIRELASKLLTAQEEERNRVARELHDDVLQRVAALSIYLGNLKRSIPKPQDPIVEELANLQRLTTTLADDIRALSHQLHPAVLKDSGVLPALRSFTTQFSRLEGVEVNLCIPNSHDQISQDVGTCVYRVVQESLRNIAKHSGAKRADVTLTMENDEVRLTVSDNGQGFDVQTARGKGLGIISMEERVRLCQGRLQMASAPNAGTILSAQFPLASSIDAVIARQDDQPDRTAGMYL